MMRFSDIFSPIKWHLLACAVVFILLPLIGYLLPVSAQAMYAVICAFLATLVITVTCIWVTITEGFLWYYPIIIIFLYVLSLFMIYPALTSEMTFSIVSHFMTAYVCQIIGVIIGKIIDRNR